MITSLYVHIWGWVGGREEGVDYVILYQLVINLLVPFQVSQSWFGNENNNIVLYILAAVTIQYYHRSF